MTIPFSPGDSVFGYGRDSGGDQQDLSTAQQEAALLQWCADQGLMLSHFYKDEARKGSSLVGRDELQTMMHQFRHGCTERGVIVWKYNRFARSIDNAQYFRGEIRSRGYVFHSITDQVPEGPMGRIFEAVVDFKDEQFLIDLSIDIKRGLHDLVRLYGCVPGTPPRGFKREPVQIGTHRDGSAHVGHRWRPDPAVAPRVLRAFEMRASHASLSSIQRETRLYTALNAWRTFFSNPLYAGTLKYGEQRFDDYCDPIVPHELWERVQAIQNGYLHRSHETAHTALHPRRQNSRFILSGLCYCLLCGSPLFGHSAIQRNKKPVDSYSCGRHYRNRDCPARRIPKATLEAVAVETLLNHILRPDVFAEAMRVINASASSVDSEQAAQRRQISSELTTVRRQLANVADAIAENGPSKTLNDRLATLEAQRLELEFHLATLTESVKSPPALSPDQFRRLAERTRSVFPSADEDAQRSVLRTFIDRIDAVREGNTVRGTIFYFYPPGDPDPKNTSAPAVSLVHDTPGAPPITTAAPSGDFFLVSAATQARTTQKWTTTPRGYNYFVRQIGILLTFVSLLAVGCGTGLSSPSGATTTQFIMTATLQPTATPPATAVAVTPTSAPTAASIEGVTSTQLNVRQQASSSGPPLGLIAALTKVEIQAKDVSGNWYQILYTPAPGGKGWVASQYVDVKDKDVIQVLAGPPGAGPSGVITQQVNVRSGPGAAFDALGRINPNDVVTLTGRDATGKWLQIQFAGGPDGKGWVAAEFVQANQLDELQAVAQSTDVLGTTASTGISPTTTATVAAAPDHDSAEAPAADVTFSPLGAGSMIYSSDLSAPVGDGEDWIRFTPYGTAVTVNLQCTGNATLETELTQNGARINAASLPACGKTTAWTVSSGLPYILKLFLIPSASQPEYDRYVLRIDSSP